MENEEVTLGRGILYPWRMNIIGLVFPPKINCFYLQGYTFFFTLVGDC